jgi:hypothetical protein
MVAFVAENPTFKKELKLRSLLNFACLSQMASLATILLVFLVVHVLTLTPSPSLKLVYSYAYSSVNNNSRRRATACLRNGQAWRSSINALLPWSEN